MIPQMHTSPCDRTDAIWSVGLRRKSIRMLLLNQDHILLASRRCIRASGSICTLPARRSNALTSDFPGERHSLTTISMSLPTKGASSGIRTVSDSRCVLIFIASITVSPFIRLSRFIMATNCVAMAPIRFVISRSRLGFFALGPVFVSRASVRLRPLPTGAAHWLLPISTSCVWESIFVSSRLS